MHEFESGVQANVISPVVAALMVSNCDVVGASVTFTVPVCSVTPDKACTRSAADPESAPVVTANVILPVVAALMAINCDVVGASVTFTVPVCTVTPDEACPRSAADPESTSVETANVISPDVAALMSSNCDVVCASVTFTVPFYSSAPD